MNKQIIVESFWAFIITQLMYVYIYSKLTPRTEAFSHWTPCCFTNKNKRSGEYTAMPHLVNPTRKSAVNKKNNKKKKTKANPITAAPHMTYLNTDINVSLWNTQPSTRFATFTTTFPSDRAYIISCLQNQDNVPVSRIICMHSKQIKAYNLNRAKK